MTIKTVTWRADVQDPACSNKCKMCGHRNIRPRYKEMFVCKHCLKETCIDCIVENNDSDATNLSCLDCVFDNLESSLDNMF